MKIKQAFQLALKSLMSSKMRSILTMLGIIIGVAAVIVIVSLVSGVTDEVLKSFEALGSTTITVTIQGRGGNRSVSINDMQDLVFDNPDVLQAMTPTVNVFNPTAKSGNININPSRCIGVNEQYFDIRKSDIEVGRALQYLDGASRLPNCVIGSYVAQELFGMPQAAVGNTLKLNGMQLNVVGVLEEMENSRQGSGDDIILVPYSVAQKLAHSLTINSYTFDAVNETTADDAQRVIEEHLQSVFLSSDYYRVMNMSSMIETISDITRQFSVALAGIAGISLLVGGIGIMNIMLVSVTERTREIGIRKALGATPWDIMSQFVVEAVTTSCVGGLIGIVLGIALSYGATAIDMNSSLSVTSIIISFTISGAIGIAFGYFPAKKASRLNPIDALRYD